VSGEDLERVLDPGPQVGPTRAELERAIAGGGDPLADDFFARVLAGLPGRYTPAEIAAALGGLADALAPAPVDLPLPAPAPMWWEQDPGGALRRVPGPGAGDVAGGRRLFSLDLAQLPVRRDGGRR
jgi:hypothetical protein